MDPKRVHFTGPLPYGVYKQVLLASSAHVYLTWPFVLSWSFLEAMSCGCLVIGSNTEPCARGPAPPRKRPAHGLPLLQERSPRTVIFALKRQDKLIDLRKNARQTILDRYCLSKCLPAHLSILADAAKDGPARFNNKK